MKILGINVERFQVAFYSDHTIPEHVPIQCMPKELGGEAPSWAEMKSEDFIILAIIQK